MLCTSLSGCLKLRDGTTRNDHSPQSPRVSLARDEPLLIALRMSMLMNAIRKHLPLFSYSPPNKYPVYLDIKYTYTYALLYAAYLYSKCDCLCVCC